MPDETPSPSLELATTMEIYRELRKRHTAVVLLLLKDAREGEQYEHFTPYSGGGRYQTAGMAQMFLNQQLFVHPADMEEDE